MKKLLLIIAFLVSGLGLNAQSVGSSVIIDYEGYSLKFTVSSVEPNNCNVECSTRPTTPTAVTIPSTVTIEGAEFNVTLIKSSAFVYCSNLTSVEIPSSVTSIGYGAFEGSSLISVTFGEDSQLATIGSSAFSFCFDLTSIEIPNGGYFYR